jgi:hypothetical protein
MVMGMLRFTPVSIGIPTLFGVFLFRHFLLIHDGIWLSDDKDTTTATTMSLIGGGFHLHCQQGPNAVFRLSLQSHEERLRNLEWLVCFSPDLIFIFMSKFNALLGRAYIALMKGGKYFQTREGKITYQLMYKDHCVILDSNIIH